MQLILTNLFRPKWQHPRPDVRKKAVGNLDPGQDNDQSILETIAREDRDPEVRRQALTKLTNADCLCQLATGDSDTGVRQAALNRLCDLVTGTDDRELPMAQRLQLLDQIAQTDYLLHVALHGDCFEIRQEAVLRLVDETALAKIVTGADNRQLRQLAAESIRDPEQLQSLIRSVRQRDKSVYRILKNRQEQQRERALQQQSRREAQEQLCQALEKLAEDPVAQHYQAKLQGLTLQWESLDFERDSTYINRFDKARTQCQLKAERYAEELAAREQAQQAQTERRNLLSLLRETNRQLTRPDAAERRIDAATLGQWLEDWQALAPLHPVSDKEQQQFSDLHAEAATLLDHWQRYDALAEQLAASSDPAELNPLLKQLAWPAPLPETPLLQRCHQLLAAVRQQQSADDSARKIAFEPLLQQLEQALDSGSLSAASDAIRPLRDQQRQLRGHNKQQFIRLNARYQELQGWQQFATAPKLESLCEAMQALAADEQQPVAARAAKLKQLQQAWKELDNPAIPHALRRQYQQANDQAYANCREYFDQQRQQRQHNLNQRERLCDQLDHLLQHTDWSSADLKSLQASNRQLRHDWRHFSPVERAQGKKLQKRFNQGLKALEQQLDALRQNNGEQKLQLTIQAEALLQQAKDPVAGAHSARELKQQWKQLGSAERSQEQQLWQRFNDACNQLHQRAKSARADSEERARREAALLCEQIETAEQALPLGIQRLQQQFDERVQELQDGRRLQRRFERALFDYQLRCHPQEPDWNQLQQLELQLQQWEKALLDGQPPAPHTIATTDLDTLAGDLREPLSRRIEILRQISSEPAVLDTQVASSDQALRLLCVRREILCGEPSPDEDQALRMEYQMSRLQDALQQDDSEPTCVKSLQQLQRQWLTVPFNGFFEELKQRFNGHSAPQE